METLLYAWPVLILLGLGLRMALRLHYGARGPEPGDPIFAMLNITSWVLMFLGVFPAIAGSAITFFGVIILFLTAAALIEGVMERRAAQQRSMCTLLALTTERGQQLELSLLLAEPAARGSVGRAMKRLLDALRGGTPLAVAIMRNPGALPREALAYVAAGRSIAAESAALTELSRRDRHELIAVWRACVDRISYLGAVLLIMSLILAFVMIKIVPEFEKIFYEFDLELPRLTKMAIYASKFCVDYLAVPLLVLTPLGLLAASFVGICYLCDYQVLQWFTDRLFRGRPTADVLRILAVATENRQPMTNVFDRLSFAYPSSGMRRQLASAASAITAGQDWRDALCDARFVNQAEQSLLKTAEQVGNLPWALRSIATRKERRTVYRLAAAVQVLYPILIVMLAGLVAFVVVSLFVPLVKLIESLSG